MTFDNFKNEYEVVMPEASRKMLSLFETKINSLGGIDKFIPLVNDEDFIDNLFDISVKKDLNKKSFYSLKTLIKFFYQFLDKNNVGISDTTFDYIQSLTLSDVIDDNDIRKYYFKSFDSMINFIELIGKETTKDKRSVQFHLSFAILAWYGVSCAEMSNMRKDDIKDEYVELQDRRIYLNEESINTLKEFANAKEKISLNGRTFEYVPSEYLFRSHAQEFITGVNIIKVIQKFNKIASTYGKELNTYALHKNYVFCLVHDYKVNKSFNKKLEDLIGAPKSFSSFYHNSYSHWLKIFYNEEG